jgi:hypothetical protein
MLTFLLVAVFGDFGIPVFHRFGWCCRPEASSLNRVPNDGISSGEHVVDQSAVDRIGFVVAERYPAVRPDRISSRGHSRLACKEF